MTVTRHTCDCLELPRLDPAPTLIYMDPPYGPRGEDKYFGVGNDRQEYISYLDARIRHLTLGLTRFNFVLHMNWRYSHYAKVMVDGILGYGNFCNEIIWSYTGPSVAAHHLPRKHDVLLWWRMAAGKEGPAAPPFNMPYVPYKSLGKATGSVWGGLSDVQHAELLARGKALPDVWTDIESLIRTSSSSRYPTQKPIALLRRIVLMLSDAGDVVLDPMCGSGAIAKVGEGRNYVLCDIAPDMVVSGAS